MACLCWCISFSRAAPPKNSIVFQNRKTRWELNVQCESHWAFSHSRAFLFLFPSNVSLNITVMFSCILHGGFCILHGSPCFPLSYIVSTPRKNINCNDKNILEWHHWLHVAKGMNHSSPAHEMYLEIFARRCTLLWATEIYENKRKIQAAKRQTLCKNFKLPSYVLWKKICLLWFLVL